MNRNYNKQMDNHQEINYLKKIIRLQDQLLNCYETDSEDEFENNDPSEISYVKKIASLQTKVLHSYETDSEDELEKSVYHDFYVSPFLREYLGDQCPMFPDRHSLTTALILKMKEEGLVDSQNKIILDHEKATYLVENILKDVPEEVKNDFSVHCIHKYIDHHFN